MPAARGISGPTMTRSGRSASARARVACERCGVEGGAARECGDAGVAGRADDLGDPRAFAQGPDERVLAAAAADDENLHASKRSTVAGCRLRGHGGQAGACPMLLFG